MELRANVRASRERDGPEFCINRMESAA